MKQPILRWVAPAGSKSELSEICARLGAAATGALEEGRLFVDAKRVQTERTVEGGSVVEVYAPHDGAAQVAILLERDGLVFVAKPPGVATEPDHAGSTASVVGQVAGKLGVPLAELHALSRLDVGVSGVVTLARTPEAQTRVERLRSKGLFRRHYLGIATHAPEPRDGTWSGAIGRGARGRWEVGGADRRPAETRYVTVAEARPLVLDGRDSLSVTPALLSLAPVTGRTHQLRAHAAHAGVPLLGDPSYGGPKRLRLSDGQVLGLSRVLLHASDVELTLGNDPLRISAPFPEDFLGLWEAIGGDAGALERAPLVWVPE